MLSGFLRDGSSESPVGKVFVLMQINTKQLSYM